MGINVFVTCDSCGVSARARFLTTGIPPLPGQAVMSLAGRDYLLPDGWSVGEGPFDACFCSQTCVDKHEAQVVVEEIEELQAKLEQIRARAKMNAQGED